MATKKPAAKAQATRTVNPLHFEDLEPHRFEDLIRQLAHDFRPWLRIEATGRLGQDEGVDIRAVEGVREAREPSTDDEDEEDDGPTLEEREWRIQCKRYKALRPKEVRQYVREAVGDGAAPYGLILAAACNVSAATLDAFHAECTKLGVVERQLWMSAHIEDMLFRPENDGLLFAYFGISLVAKRRSKLQDLRHDLAIKRKLVRLLKVEDIEHAIKFEELLVRDIEDTQYPRHDEVPGFDQSDCPPWHVVIPDAFHHEGLFVKRFHYSGWVRDDGTWDVLEHSRRSVSNMLGREYRRQLAEALGLEDEEWRAYYHPEIMDRVPEDERATFSELWILPLSSILMVDEFGDRAYAGPHLFCVFKNPDGGPYYASLQGRTYRRDCSYGGERHAAEEDRRALFEQLTEGAPALIEEGTATTEEDVAGGLDVAYAAVERRKKRLARKRKER